MPPESETDSHEPETVAPRRSALRRPELTVERIVLAALVSTSAVLAFAMHRRGHTWGDDFTLYTNQARSLYTGHTRQVIEDNRFAVLNSATPTFSPYGYPWVWPIVLSPFVALVGLEWDRLTWVVVAIFCLCLLTTHRLVRRRLGPVASLAIVAVLGLSPYLLEHTDKLLSEFPYLLAVMVALLFLDRLTLPERGWSTATTRQLVVLGLLVAVAFNIRREGMALLPAIGAAQIVGRAPWRRIWIPHVTFVASAVAFQLLLPTALLPRYPGDGFHLAGDMLRGPFPRGIASHLTLGADGYALTVWILAAALVGALARMVRHARTDIALFVVPVGALIAFARFPFNGDHRYYIQILPFALYFVAQLPSTLAELARPRGRELTASVRRGAAAVGAAAIFALAVVQVWHLPSALDEVRTFNDAGSIQFGPSDPAVLAVLDAVEEVTPPDAIVAFMKARTMTLYTGRRAIQSSDLFVVLQRADYLAMLRNSDFSQPLVTQEIADTYGMTEVWSDSRWIIWRVDASDR